MGSERQPKFVGRVQGENMKFALNVGPRYLYSSGGQEHKNACDVVTNGTESPVYKQMVCPRLLSSNVETRSSCLAKTVAKAASSFDSARASKNRAAHLW